MERIDWQGHCLRYQPAKLRIEFRRAACDIHRRNISATQRVDSRLGNFALHDHPSAWTGIDMTVRACLATELADVDL